MTDALLANPERFLMALLFAMLRAGGAFLTAPIFAQMSVPVQLRILLAAALAVSVVATHPLPTLDLLSAAGMLAAVGELTIGLALGFVLQLAFTGPMIAGEQIAAGAGLGFAAFSDPQSGAVTPAIGQFLSLLMTLLFLAFDGHLKFLEILVRSYSALPPGDAFPSGARWGELAHFGGFVFMSGFMIALPVTAALFCVNLTLGVLTRAAPQMNIFAVGLPISVMTAMAMLALAFPALVDLMRGAAETGIATLARLAGVQ